jgi:hypothetical protein
MPYYLNPPPQGPLTRLIASIVAVIVLIGAFMLGMVALLVIAGVTLVAGLAIWPRVAWIKRQLRKSGVNLDAHMDAHRDTTRESGHVIDAEYTVVTDPEDKKDE